MCPRDGRADADLDDRLRAARARYRLHAEELGRTIVIVSVDARRTERCRAHIASVIARAAAAGIACTYRIDFAAVAAP